MSQRVSRKSTVFALLLALFAGFAVVICVRLVTYRPDRPVADILPASSAGPAFVVQVIRPRAGLPLGGLVPPEVFGLDEHLGFDSTSEGATIRHVTAERIEIGSDHWDLLLVLDDQGRITAETEVVFDLVFEERLRRVRCRPGQPVVGRLNTVALAESGELSGNFDIELAHCEDAESETPLQWPPSPLVLHGSFDRLSPTELTLR